ncbi:DNA repair protein complementing XP-C cells homolog [Gryllus bimaculatus]|nr:DNA repair protein complementing XP-C cells homolog [Gryllus bimaculatus]
MKPRRSKRLSKSPVIKDNDSSDFEDNGKKQKLQQPNTLTNNESIEKNITNEQCVGRNGFDKQSISPNVNGNDSDSSDSSVDYMKSPQTLDFDSDFFKVDFRKKETSLTFEDVEKKMFDKIQRLTDTESSDDEDCKKVEYIPIPLPFSQQTLVVDIKSENDKSKQKLKTKRVKSRPGLSVNESSNKKKHPKVKVQSETKSVDSMDVSELLALGETQVTNDVKNASHHFSSEEELTDWEEVKEEKKEIKKEPHSFPKEGVQITVDAPELYHKRKKKDFDMAAFLKRRMNQVKREQQVLIHKVHLLCWIAHGLHVNAVLNSQELMGLSLSLIPSKHSYPNKVDLIYLKDICKWFMKTVPVVEIPSEKSTFVPLLESLQQQFANGTAKSQRDLVFLFICLLRSIGVTTRLIISLQPVPLKPSTIETVSVKTERGRPRSKNPEKSKVEKRVLSPEEAKQLNKKVLSKDEAIKRLKSSENNRKTVAAAKKPRVEKPSSKEKSDDEKTLRRSIRPRKTTENKYKDASSSSEEIATEEEEGKKAMALRKRVTKKEETKSGSSVKKNNIEKVENIEVSKNISKKDGSKVKQDKSSKKEIPTQGTMEVRNAVKIKEEISEKHVRENSNSSKNSDIQKNKQNTKFKTQARNDIKPSTSHTSEDEFLPQSQKESNKKILKKNATVKKSRSSTNHSESESDFEQELSLKVKQGRRSSSTQNDIERRVLSSDSDDSGDSDNKNKTKNDFWLEVLIDSEKWIPIDISSGEVNCAGKLYKRATKPVSYIVAWNPDMTLKDITRKYCAQFHSVTRKQRVDEKWWRESLFPFLTGNTAHDKKEDEDMQKQIEEMPLPKSISEYKNHPLYALQRHLLKFQAIYPPKAPTLGYIRGEPVYRRECVYTLHSREIWLKEAKVVRLGEKPYKIVKARPKWDRMSGKVITDLPLEIFGPWQVEDYVPPTAVDGKVPRNAYGNVELFKPSMLPKGTVHLQVPGLNRVAKKLQIDCAPAVVGFDFHCGASHPMYDGFVVCEEFQDVLLDAWNRDQEESERREQEKRDKRIYGNWRKLIKGLLIRERLKVKYGFGESEPSTSKSKKGQKSKLTNKKSKEEEDDDTD